jgi:hypothetical protein
MDYIHGEWVDAAVNTSTSGDQTIVASSSTSQTHILVLSVIATGATDVTIKLGARTVGFFKLAAGQSINLSGLANLRGAPYFICEKGEAFILNSSAATNLSGTVKYALNQP